MRKRLLFGICATSIIPLQSVGAQPVEDPTGSQGVAPPAGSATPRYEAGTGAPNPGTHRGGRTTSVADTAVCHVRPMMVDRNQVTAATATAMAMLADRARRRGATNTAIATVQTPRPTSTKTPTARRPRPKATGIPMGRSRGPMVTARQPVMVHRLTAMAGGAIRNTGRMPGTGRCPMARMRAISAPASRAAHHQGMERRSPIAMSGRVHQAIARARRMQVGPMGVIQGAMRRPPSPEGR